MATIPITKRGAEKLKVELQRLKTVERPAVIQAIAEAVAKYKPREIPEIAKAWFKRDAITVLPISPTIVSEAQATSDFLYDAKLLKKPYDVTPMFDRAL